MLVMGRTYIGDELRQLREQSGLSQMKLADALGCHWRSIQDWESGRTAVDTFKAKAILAEVRKLAKKPRRRKT